MRLVKILINYILPSAKRISQALIPQNFFIVMRAWLTDNGQ